LQLSATLVGRVLEVQRHVAHLELLLKMEMHNLARSACKLLLPELLWKLADSLGPARHGSIQSWWQSATVSHPCEDKHCVIKTVWQTFSA
jgi:hypothetical protein